MESALLNLVGTAIAACAAARQRSGWASAPKTGSTLIADGLEAGAGGLATVIEGTTRRFWSAIREDAAIDGDLNALFRHVNEMIDAALARGSLNGRLAPAHEKWAASILDLAHHILDLQQSPRSSGRAERETSQARTLVALFEALSINFEDVYRCLDDLEAVCAFPVSGTYTPRRRHTSNDLDALASRLAEDTGLAPTFVSAIVENQTRAGFSTDWIAETLPDQIVVGLGVLTDAMKIADRAGGDEDLESQMLDVAQALRSGDFRTAQSRLAELSRVREADCDNLEPDLTGLALSPALLDVRARIAAITGQPREAANLFDRAAQVWPRTDRLPRWRMKISQARQLASAGRLPGEKIATLCEAAQAYAAAGGLICEQDSPHDWAEANVELGMLLLKLGHHESRPERYLAAALHFKPALVVFGRQKYMDGWARAQIGLAHALRGQGSFQGDIVTLSDASFAYRAALGILTESVTPDLWRTARCCLAESLVRIAEESGDVDALQQALELLMPLADPTNDAIAKRMPAIGNLALGRAMLFLIESEENGESDSDPRLLDDAIGCLRSGLNDSDATLTDLDRARAEDRLGNALWIRSSGIGAARGTTEVIAAKTRARDIYERLDLIVEAETIDEEIASLNTENPRGPHQDADEQSLTLTLKAAALEAMPAGLNFKPY